MSVPECSVGADPVPTYDYYGAIVPRAYPRSCEMRLAVRLRDYAESDRFMEYVQDYFQGHRGLARDAVSRELERTKGDYLTALDEIEKLKKLVIDLSRYASPKGPEHFCGPLGGLLAQVEVETNLPEEVLSTPTLATIGGAKEVEVFDADGPVGTIRGASKYVPHDDDYRAARWPNLSPEEAEKVFASVLEDVTRQAFGVRSTP